MRRAERAGAAALAAALALAAAAAPAAPPVDAARCERAATAALSRCFSSLGRALRACYIESGRTCDASDAGVADALAALETRVEAACADDATVQALGLAPLLTRDAFVDRLAEACDGHAQALASRAFGGPHGAPLRGADADAVSCREAAYTETLSLARRAFRIAARCAQRARGGRACAAIANLADLARARAIARLDARCPDLETLTGSDAATFADRAQRDASCLTAATNADPARPLSCGPRGAVPVPPRGIWTQIVLDEASWGSRCGDGSPYAFWVRLAPPGAAPENVLVHLQGGGVCVLGGDCSRRSSGLFEALSDYTSSGGPVGGILSSDPLENPFGNWTLAALPYCTQDIFIGGGATQVFPEITVHRFGALNVRAALRYLRDVIWSELDATSPEGYRPDRIRAILTGSSAGGFGTSYSYHFVLDDLRWIHTTAVPDSSQGLEPGLTALGLIATAATGWAPQSIQPPYCVGAACFPIPSLHTAHSERLLGVPAQRILAVSNQVDNVQRATTGFATLGEWTTAMRGEYCATRDLPGLRFFLPAEPSSTHVILRFTSLFTSLLADGVAAREWLADAVQDPDGVVDRVEEGTLAATLGIDPFPCVVD